MTALRLPIRAARVFAAALGLFVLIHAGASAAGPQPGDLDHVGTAEAADPSRAPGAHAGEAGCLPDEPAGACCGAACLTALLPTLSALPSPGPQSEDAPEPAARIPGPGPERPLPPPKPLL